MTLKTLTATGSVCARFPRRKRFSFAPTVMSHGASARTFLTLRWPESFSNRHCRASWAKPDVTCPTRPRHFDEIQPFCRSKEAIVSANTKLTEAGTSKLVRIKEGDLDLQIHYNDMGQRLGTCPYHNDD